MAQIYNMSACNSQRQIHQSHSFMRVGEPSEWASEKVLSAHKAIVVRTLVVNPVNRHTWDLWGMTLNEFTTIKLWIISFRYDSIALRPDFHLRQPLGTPTFLYHRVWFNALNEKKSTIKKKIEMPKIVYLNSKKFVQLIFHSNQSQKKKIFLPKNF